MSAALELRPIFLAASQALEQRARRARRSFDEFAEFALLDHVGQPFEQGAIHRVWNVHAEWCWRNGIHPAILAPMEHGKTASMVVGRAAYEIGCDPNVRIKVVCNSDDNAKARVMGITNILSSHAYKLAFPGVEAMSESELRKKGIKATWTQHRILVRREGQAIDPTVHGASVLGSGTGGRADLLFLDDCVDQKNAVDSPGLRPKVTQNIDRVWMTRLTPTGRVLYIATPWHLQDHTHVLMGRSAWCVLRQWIADDCSCIHQEVYNAPPGYPLPAAAG